MEEEDFEMLNFCVCKENDVLAKPGSWIGCRDIYVEGSVRDLFILEGDLLEAAAFVGHFRVSFADFCGKNRQEHSKVLWFLPL